MPKTPMTTGRPTSASLGAHMLFIDAARHSEAGDQGAAMEAIAKMAPPPKRIPPGLAGSCAALGSALAMKGWSEATEALAVRG